MKIPPLRPPATRTYIYTPSENFIKKSIWVFKRKGSRAWFIGYRQGLYAFSTVFPLLKTDHYGTVANRYLFLGEDMTRAEMYGYYADELKEYGAYENDVEIFVDINTYLRRADRNECIWKDVVVDGEPVGFLIVETDSDEKPADTDYFIAQTYISRRYRHKGIMHGFVSNFIKEHPGSYCLYILDKNLNGKRFWKGIENGNNLSPINLVNSVGDDEPETCPLYGFIYEEKGC